MKRVRSEDFEDLEELRESVAWDFWSDSGMGEEVKSIIYEVERGRDRALVELTMRFDGVDIGRRGIRVKSAELEGSRDRVDLDFAEAVKTAARNITSFHRHQDWEPEYWDSDEGARVGQMLRPIRRVGIYVPGGNAAYPSTALMTVIPAKVAGVSEISVCVPPGEGGDISPHTLYVLDYLEITEVYRLGGAQAVAALALGTETIPPVDKVVGPGNMYVTLAKKEVFGRVGIDMLAGPSELVVLADGTADHDNLACDMMAQMEHGSGARSCLITDDETLADGVEKGLTRALSKRGSLKHEASAVIVRDMDEGARLADLMAPEHLYIEAEDITGILSKIHNAGAIFLGPDSPVALGDYAVGVNHVLPTKGAARFSSPLGVYDFIKRSNVIFSNPRANRALGDVVVALAEVEGLVDHAESMRRRL